MNGSVTHQGVTQQGFTLFEILIAISIFALVGSFANSMIQKGSALSEANERLSSLQFAVVYFARDWAQVSPRRIRNQYGDEENNIVIENDVISFTRSGWSNPLGNDNTDHKRSNLQRVQYLLVDNQLKRRHWPSLDQGIGEEPFEVLLLDKVDTLQFQFQDAGGAAIQSWPAPPSTVPGSSPIVLELVMDVANFGEIRRLLEVPSGVL